MFGILLSLLMRFSLYLCQIDDYLKRPKILKGHRSLSPLVYLEPDPFLKPYLLLYILLSCVSRSTAWRSLPSRYPRCTLHASSAAFSVTCARRICASHSPSALRREHSRVLLSIDMSFMLLPVTFLSPFCTMHSVDVVIGCETVPHRFCACLDSEELCSVL